MTALSPRELQLVEMVGRDGKSWPKVKVETGLSMGTIRSYVARIMNKTKLERPPREALTELYWREVHASLGADTPGAD